MSINKMEFGIPPEQPQQTFDQNRLVIDGSVLEGGGQILRNSAALSCILGIPIKVINVRAGRQKSGLRPQHMTGLELISQICGGQLTGCQVGSTQLTFDPGQMQSGHYVADIQTAGSVCLLLQAAGPCLPFAPVECHLLLKGGTNCDSAPQIDYTTRIFKPISEKFGMLLNMDIKRRGYFPKGGGEIEVISQPSPVLNGINMTERGDITKIYSRSYVAGTLPDHLSGKVSKYIARAVQHNFDTTAVSLHQDSLKEPPGKAVGNGLGTIIVAESSTGCLFGGSALGRPKRPPEDTASVAVAELLAGTHHGGCVDQYMQDQLILLMALAEGQSKLLCGPLTLHTQTAIHIARLMTKAEFSVEPVDPDTDSVMLTCKGIGHRNPFLSSSPSSTSI